MTATSENKSSSGRLTVILSDSSFAGLQQLADSQKRPLGNMARVLIEHGLAEWSPEDLPAEQAEMPA